jgi:hypothetical protein
VDVFNRREPRLDSTAAAPIREAAEWVERYRGFWESRLDALATSLENNGPDDGGKDEEDDRHH